MIQAEEGNSFELDVNGEVCHVCHADLNLVDTIACEDCDRQVCHETCTKPIPSEVCTPCQLRRFLRDHNIRGIPAENVKPDRESDRAENLPQPEGAPRVFPTQPIRLGETQSAWNGGGEQSLPTRQPQGLSEDVLGERLAQFLELRQNDIGNRALHMGAHTYAPAPFKLHTTDT